GAEMATYANNFVAHLVVTFTAYLIFGGLKLFSRHKPQTAAADVVAVESFERVHWITIGILGSLVIGVIGWNLNIGMAALTGAALLSLFGAADEKEAIRRMPWGVVLMVCGVTVLIGVLEETQGMD